MSENLHIGAIRGCLEYIPYVLFCLFTGPGLRFVPCMSPAWCRRVARLVKQGANVNNRHVVCYLLIYLFTWRLTPY